jgi:hypothetical protein
MQKKGQLENFHAINDRLGCFVEKEWIHFRCLSFVSLVEFDFIGKVFNKLKTFQFVNTQQERIFADEYNPSKFTLVW